jgi:acetylornithine deacetylase
VRNRITAAGCIVGEPTAMQPVIANKGMRTFRCSVRGKEAHSALAPHAVNAIEYAARLVAQIRSIADRMRASEPRDTGFEVPFTTLQTGLIRGGTAPNIVPRECEFHFEFRYLPGADPQALEDEIKAYAREVLEPEMKAVEPQAGFEFFTKAEIPGLDTGETDKITALAQALSRNRGLTKVAYAAEAGLFQQAGIPSIICGPGSIEQAHKPNEFIALDQVARCEAFLERLVEALTK